MAGAAHRPVTYSNLIVFFLGVCPGFDSFYYFQPIFQNNYLYWTLSVTGFEIYIYIFFKIAFLSLRQEWKLFLMKG